MELNNLKSPCDGCEHNTSNKLNCINMKKCSIYKKWLREVMDEVRDIFLKEKLEKPIMKKCVTCKHGVFLELWGEWKCRKFEKHCYNNDLYYLNCKGYQKKRKTEEEEEKDD